MHLSEIVSIFVTIKFNIMERKIIEKEPVMTNLTDVLNDTKYVRNKKGYTYTYVAEQTEYKNSKNIEKNFFDKIGDLDISNDGWSYTINTTFLDEIKPGTIIEVGINIQKSNNYSHSSKTYFVVSENEKDSITVLKTDTPYKAFKAKSNFIESLKK